MSAGLLPRAVLPALLATAVTLSGCGGRGDDTPVNPKPVPADQITKLPGWAAGTPPTLMFAGFASINFTYKKQLFYWFAECEKGSKPGSTPLILWLNGGPGASSMTGFLTENIGPLTLNTDGTLRRNLQSWTSFANVIAIDNPVGSGFSHTLEGGYVTSEAQMASDLHKGLLAFFEMHPEYSTNPLWVSGESYAGKYVPNFAWEAHVQQRTNLQGVVIGNGMYRPEVQYATVPEFAFANGLVDEVGKAEAEKRFGRCVDMINAGQSTDAFKYCEGTLKWLYYDLAGGVFQYDVGEEDPHHFDSLTKAMGVYLNSEETRAALHVGKQLWVQHDEEGPVSDGLAADFVGPSDMVLEKLLTAGYEVVTYNGIRDGSLCNHLGNLQVLLKLDWAGSHDWLKSPQQPWVCGENKLLCGYIREAHNMQYYVFLRTGHLVPTTVPTAAVEMWRRILARHDGSAVVL